MRPMSTSSTVGLLAIVLALGACGGGGGSSSIAGTYECTVETGPNRTFDVFEFRDDGTVSQDIKALGRTIQATWSAEGDTVRVISEAGNLTFTIKGDRLVEQHGMICTPKD